MNEKILHDTQIQELNDDCLEYIFSFLSIIDRIRLQRGKQLFTLYFT
jgi:hypothetical protein